MLLGLVSFRRVARPDLCVKPCCLGGNWPRFSTIIFFRRTMQAMLLAAGFGTRLRPYTTRRPKPLFPVCNVLLLHMLLDKLVAAGCDRIVVNGHHLADQVEAAVADRAEVLFQNESAILGTGGSLRRALPLLRDEPLLVMNGDLFHAIDLQALYRHHLETRDLVSMAMHDYPRFNNVVVAGDRIVGFGHTPGAGEIRLAFTGIHVMEQSVIRAIPEQVFFHIIELYAQLAEQKKIGCARVDGAFWQDIGTPEDYLDLHRHLLLKGQQDAKNGWLISEGASVAASAVLDDWGVIGDGAVVGEKAHLTRCVVWDSARVAPGQERVDSIIVPD